jgi:hypothetical protein
MASNVSRRLFIEKGLALSAVAVGAALLPIDGLAQTEKIPAPPVEPKRPDPLDHQMVLKFVQNSHRNLDEVKVMLKAEPTLVNATWDWGGGDWETGLGGASHMGRRDIAIEKGYTDIADLLRKHGGEVSGS